MWRHIKRVGGGVVATIVLGVGLLMTDIPKTLDQMDKSFAFIAKSLGSSAPPEHAVTSAWAHPWFIALVFFLVFVIGVFLSWACERSWRYLTGDAADTGPPASDPAHDVSLTEAALYTVTGKWGMIAGKEHFPTNEQRIAAGNGVANWLSDFEQKASDGKVRAWGKPLETPSSPFVEIDAMQWRTHEAYPIGVALGQPSTRQRGNLLKGNGFTDIRVSRAEFEREWPHAG